MTDRSVLAINSGSSSLKFGLFARTASSAPPKPIRRGTLEGAAGVETLDRLLAEIGDRLATQPLAGIGHRIVHGGPSLVEPRLVTDETMATLRQIVPFAPNHLPNEIALIEAASRRWPGVPQVVCFDTAFHSTLPDVARRLPIPEVYDAQGVRRYGFHGLSYTFLLGELRQRAGAAAADGRIVLMHLGSGSSLAAVRGGRSLDTSMGFTPIGGVVMSTRSGDLDPGVVTFIARSTGFDATRLEDEFSHRSGLAAVSGGVADMRELLAREEHDDGCRLAVSMYCYDITKRIGAYAAALGGIDTLVFSGGIGEHAPIVRARICRALAFLDIELDERANQEDAPVISLPTRRVAVHVIPTDEEAVIAAAVCQLLSDPHAD